jgi:hypothetical protein
MNYNEEHCFNLMNKTDFLFKNIETELDFHDYLTKMCHFIDNSLRLIAAAKSSAIEIYHRKNMINNYKRVTGKEVEANIGEFINTVTEYHKFSDLERSAKIYRKVLKIYKECKRLLTEHFQTKYYSNIQSITDSEILKFLRS